MDLIKCLPPFYYRLEEVKNIQVSIQAEDIKIKQAIEDVLNQLLVDYATWGLDNWERMLNLKIDKNETYENRRARIKMRLRGTGTFNKTMVKNLCKSFVNGEVCVIENNSDNSFVIKFIDIKGIPGNLEYLKGAIEEVKPAHLAFTFVYTYLTWNEFDNYNKTFDAWDALNLIWNEFEVYKEVV